MNPSLTLLLWCFEMSHDNHNAHTHSALKCPFFFDTVSKCGGTIEIHPEHIHTCVNIEQTRRGKRENEIEL